LVSSGLSTIDVDDILARSLLLDNDDIVANIAEVTDDTIIASITDIDKSLVILFPGIVLIVVEEIAIVEVGVTIGIDTDERKKTAIINL